jgi:hypothetical protein
MAFINSLIQDEGLQVLSDDANRIDLCSQEPTTYAEATSTYTLGNKTSYSVGNPEARTPDGRKVVCDAVTDGSITATGTVTHWAIVDTANSRLLAVNTLSASQAVTDGNTWAIAAFDIGIADPS